LFKKFEELRGEGVTGALILFVPETQTYHLKGNHDFIDGLLKGNAIVPSEATVKLNEDTYKKAKVDSHAIVRRVSNSKSNVVRGSPEKSLTEKSFTSMFSQHNSLINLPVFPDTTPERRVASGEAAKRKRRQPTSIFTTTQK
jgi:hypothetical protein